MSNEHFYKNLVENLNEKAVLFCSEKLVRYLPFVYLKPENVRGIDIIEILMQNDKELKEEYKVFASAGSLYAFLLKRYICEFARCNDNSILAAYKIKALDKIPFSDTKLDKGVTFNDINDALMVFLSFYRVLCKYKKDYYKRVVINTNFVVKTEDADILIDVLRYPYVIPKTIFGEMKKKNKKIDAYLEKRKVTQFFVMVSILLLAGLLQECGEFED